MPLPAQLIAGGGLPDVLPQFEVQTGAGYIATDSDFSSAAHSMTGFYPFVRLKSCNILLHCFQNNQTQFP